MAYGRENLRRRTLYASRLWKCAWQVLKEPMRRRYRPEQHYMRGPGPKFRAKGIGRSAKTTGALGKTSVNGGSERD
jgi:hypothetical protein